MDVGDLNSLEMEVDLFFELLDLDEILNKKNWNYSNLWNDLFDNSNLIIFLIFVVFMMFRGVIFSVFLIICFG